MNEFENVDVLLIHMPFGINYIPSLSLSLLKQAVINKGFTSTIKYFSIKFAKLIGEVNYLHISSGRPVYHYLLGEWIFSRTLFKNLPPDQEYFKEILIGDEKDHLNLDPKVIEASIQFINLIPGVKKQTEAFINSCLEEVIALNPKIVGFSSSFQQQIASLSLAKRIKEKLPETKIVFGGANCEGEMGLEMIRQFPFVDVIVSGEADETFPLLVESILNKVNYSEIQGVICRDNLEKYENRLINSPMIKDMDSLPIPNFDDYFSEIKNYDAKGYINFVLLFESSRGAGGAKRAIVLFCGLNGDNMAHRSKSSQRVIDEIKFLVKKYQVHQFSATDNILDMAYFKDFVPALAKENLNLDIFYEVKANLTKEQLIMLKEANINEIQPGVESLNTHVLDLMKKGVKSIQNVQLLKWCKELGITAKWGIIYGFPGETKEDYFEMAELIPKISHLSYPPGVTKLRLDRFSPNYNFPEKFGVTKIGLLPAYKYIYPFAEDSLKKLAYFFDYEYIPDENFEQGLNAARNEVYKWKLNSSNSDLFYFEQQDALIIFDLRKIRRKPYYILYKKEKFIYKLCDKIQPFTKIKKELAKNYQQEINESEINDILEYFINHNLMLRENNSRSTGSLLGVPSNSYLSLAIPVGHYSPNKDVMAKLVKVLKASPEVDNQITISENNELLIRLN